MYKFLNLDQSQWCGKRAGNTEAAEHYSTLLQGKGPLVGWLAIPGCKHAPDFEKIRSTSSIIPELWQGQCIIYGELKPQVARCCLCA